MSPERHAMTDEKKMGGRRDFLSTAGKVLGMVSGGDLTHWLIRDQAMEIRDLVDTASR